MARPYRIYRVNSFEKKALARREKNYTTKPQMLPTLIFPNLSEGNIFRAFSCSDLIATECNLQVRESLSGYKERRGPNEVGVSYPTASDGIYFKMPRFTRNYFTSGLVLTHPILNAENVKCDLLAEVFFEAFLMLVPFERRDISFAIDKHRVDRGPIAKDSKFIAIYDQTYGSLRLSGRLLEGNILQQTFELMAKLLLRDEVPEVNRETLSAATTILECFAREATETSLKPEEGFITPTNCERIIVPKSRGVNILRNNEEFEVEAVFYSPLIGGLSYRGRYLSTTGEVSDIVSIKSIVEIPGESIMGFYNFENGEITTEQ
jgi:DEAD/DEAH box helicase domain-containing protein